MTEAAQPIQSIVGLSLSGIGRALNMGIFSFGPDVTWIDSTTRETRIDSKYAIHVQCPFRLTRNGHTLVGSDDMRIPGNALSRATNHQLDEQEVTAFDVIVDRITEGTRFSPLVVQGVNVALGGDLCLELSDQVTIEAFPMAAGPIEA